jgi:hypothetical protein
MKSGLIYRTILLAVAISAPQMARSQGTITYVSSLGSPSVGSAAVGSDSWEAVEFFTGNNPGGYVFESVELAMAPASGSPAGFEVMLYSAGGINAALPENSLATLSGSSDPATGRVYSYTSSDLTLSPSTTYYIVLTADTAVASGPYAWSIGNSLASTTGGWGGWHWSCRFERRWFILGLHVRCSSVRRDRHGRSRAWPFRFGLGQLVVFRAASLGSESTVR